MVDDIEKRGWYASVVNGLGSNASGSRVAPPFVEDRCGQSARVSPEPVLLFE